jgi:hypothetical protein
MGSNAGEMGVRTNTPAIYSAPDRYSIPAQQVGSLAMFDAILRASMAPLAEAWCGATDIRIAKVTEGNATAV